MFASKIQPDKAGGQALAGRTFRLWLHGFGSHVTHRSLGAGVHMELVKDMLQVAANRVDAQLQFVGDQLVGIALR